MTQEVILLSVKCLLFKFLFSDVHMGNVSEIIWTHSLSLKRILKNVKGLKVVKEFWKMSYTAILPSSKWLKKAEVCILMKILRGSKSSYTIKKKKLLKSLNSAFL